jgi:hypothetical protein
MIRKLPSPRDCKGQSTLHYKDLELNSGITLYLRSQNEIQFQINYKDNTLPFVRFEISREDFQKMMDWFSTPQEYESHVIPAGVNTWSTKSIV